MERCSARARLDHAHRRRGGCNARQGKAGACKKGRKVVRAALTPAREHEHLDVNELREIRFVARAYDSLEQDDPAMTLVTECLPDVLEDDRGAFVIPVVDDVLHHIGVALWHGLEEVAGLRRAAL